MFVAVNSQITATDSNTPKLETACTPHLASEQPAAIPVSVVTSRTMDQPHSMELSM